MQPSLRHAIAAALCAASFPTAGCMEIGLTLKATVDNMNVNVEEKLLIASLDGSFDVKLELGEQAGDSCEVSFSAFSLVRADDGSDILSKNINALTETATPVTISPGNSRTISFAIGELDEQQTQTTGMELPKADYASICNAGPVRIVVGVQNSANGERPTPVRSKAFDVTGCT